VKFSPRCNRIRKACPTEFFYNKGVFIYYNFVGLIVMILTCI